MLTFIVNAMICNTIVCNDDLKKNVEDQLEEIKQVIEIETTVDENSNKRSLENDDKYGNNNYNVVESPKKYKIRSHPQSQQSSVTGGINKCVRWVKEMNEMKSNKKSKPNE